MSAMNLMQMLLDGDGQRSTMQAGQQVGLDPQQTKMAMGALLPALSGALKRQAADPNQLQGLMSALQKGNHDRYLEDPQMMSRPETVQDGNAILGHLFGSKDMSRAVASRASEQTGLDTGILKKLLPLAATMVMGSMGRQSRQPDMQSMLMGMAAKQMMGGASRGGGGMGGGLGNMIGGILGGGRPKTPRMGGMAAPQAPQAGTRPGGAMGILNQMMDADGDGSAMDDLFEKFMRR